MNIIVNFIKFNKARQLINLPFIVRAGDKIYRFQEGQDKLNECNNKEADTRTILLAYQETNEIVVVAKDTNVLVLLVWAYAHYNMKHNWLFKYDAKKYANIRKICGCLGKDVCESILAFHAITSLDTTSYFFRAGKVKTFKNQTKLKLIKELGEKDKLSDNHMKSAKDFIRSGAGEFSENYMGTRVKICKNVNKKTSLAIPSDLDSVEFAIKREHLQTFTCLCWCNQNIQTLDSEEFGWKLTDGQLKPLWSVTGRIQGKQTDGNDADSESSDPDDGPPKKKPRA